MELNFLPGEHLPGRWSVFLVGGSLRTGNSSEVTVVGKLGRAETGSAERCIGFFLTEKWSPVRFQKLRAFILAYGVFPPCQWNKNFLPGGHPTEEQSKLCDGWWWWGPLHPTTRPEEESL